MGLLIHWYAILDHCTGISYIRCAYIICEQAQRRLTSRQCVRCYSSQEENPEQNLYGDWCVRHDDAHLRPLIVESFPCLPVQSRNSEDAERNMDLPAQVSRFEVVGNEAEDGLDQDEDEDG